MNRVKNDSDVYVMGTEGGMRSRGFLCAGVALAPPVAIVLVPGLRFLGPALTVAGFLLLISMGLAVTFWRSKLGPFAQWIQPGAFSSAKLTSRELFWLSLSGCIALGGFLGVIATLLSH
jgi:hypothetical protein